MPRRKITQEQQEIIYFSGHGDFHHLISTWHKKSCCWIKTAPKSYRATKRNMQKGKNKAKATSKEKGVSLPNPAESTALQQGSANRSALSMKEMKTFSLSLVDVSAELTSTQGSVFKQE